MFIRFPSSSLRWIGLLVWLVAGIARAETAADLYRTAIPVTEQSPAELKRAASLGLTDVLGRVSGNAEAGAQPALRDPVANADRYIEQYRYERAGDGSLQLALQFAPATIANLLRGAGLMAAPVARQGLQLRVDGIENFADYTALLAYLNGLGTVKAQPQSLDGATVTLALQVQGDSAQLAQQFAAGQRLLPEVATSGPELRYRWQGRGG